MTEPMYPVLFKWLSVEPDKRPYKPNKPILEPIEIYVEVNIPLTVNYIANSSEILQAQISNSNAPKPKLTPSGLEYCLNELGIVQEKTEENFEDWQPENFVED